MTLRRPIALAFVLAGLAACGEDDPAGPGGPFEVTVDRSAITVMEGDTAILSFTVADTGGAAVQVRPAWSSEDAGVARVSATGVVTGIAVGTTRIVAAAGGDTARVDVSVTPAAASASIAASQDSVTVGRPLQLALDVLDAGGRAVAAYPVEWSSSNPEIATVDDSGRVRTFGIGDAQLTVRVGPFTDVVTLRARLPRLAPGEDWAYVQGNGEQYVCALTTAGAPWCWGVPFRNRLGVDESVHGGSLLPRPVNGNNTFVQLNVGDTHSCGLAADSTAWCWGHSGHGQTGPLTPGVFGRHTPIQHPVDRKWARIAAGGHGGTCGITSDSLAWCWGHSDQNQIGRDTLAADLPDVALAFGGR